MSAADAPTLQHCLSTPRRHSPACRTARLTSDVCGGQHCGRPQHLASVWRVQRSRHGERGAAACHVSGVGPGAGARRSVVTGVRVLVLFDVSKVPKISRRRIMSSARDRCSSHEVLETDTSGRGGAGTADGGGLALAVPCRFHGSDVGPRRTH